jgi:predicted dehydrogenase
MTAEDCTVAIVGAGNMAREHIRAFSDVPGVTIAAIHSRTRSRAESLAKKFNIPSVFDSIPDLYEKTNADLVVVAVFETAMNQVSKKCFEFPWTAFLEKPPGYNLEDAEDIAAYAKKMNRRVIVGLNRRFLSSTRSAFDDLQVNSGPRYIHVQDQQSLKIAAEIGHPDIVVKNWMYANSIHLIDYLRLFGRGNITKVTPVFRWNAGRSGIVVAGIEFSSGDMGVYEGIWEGPGPWAVDITTPVKRWEIKPLEKAVYQNWGDRTIYPVEIHPRDSQFKPGFRLQAEHAVAAALGRESESPTLGQAMETMRLIKGIFEI